MRLIIIPPSSPATIHLPGALPNFETLRELMGLPPATFLEYVPITYEGQPAHLFCDEDGRAKGLPINYSASSIVEGWCRRPITRFVGPVAIWTGRME